MIELEDSLSLEKFLKFELIYSRYALCALRFA